MRNLTIILLAVLILSSFALSADARPKTRYDAATDTCRVLDSGPLEWASRPWGAGGKSFRNVCQNCHSRGNSKGAPFLWAESKSSKGWNRVFNEKYPKCARDGSWDVLNQEEKMEVNDYLYRWAQNSQGFGDNC